MRKTTLKASLGVNVGIFKFGIEGSRQWEEETRRRQNEPFLHFDEIQSLQNDVRNLQTRLAVFERELPRLAGFRSVDRRGYSRFLAETNQQASSLKLDTALLSLPHQVNWRSLGDVCVFDPTNLLPLATSLRDAGKTSLINTELGRALNPGLYPELKPGFSNMLDAGLWKSGAFDFASLAQSVPSTVQHGGSIERLWVDYNVYENEILGMRIHLRFTVRNLKNVRCNASAYFQFDSGMKLTDINQKFRNSAGQVSVGANFTPLYADTIFNDFQLFMPYSELHLGKGFYNLSFYVSLYNFSTSNHFADSQHVPFTWRSDT